SRPRPAAPAQRSYSAPQSREVDRTIIEPGEARECGFRTRRIPAAVLGVEHELVLDIVARQRLIGTAAEGWLALLDDAAVSQRRADVAGECIRIGIVRVDHVTDLGGERQHRLVAHRSLGEGIEADIAVDEA